MSESVIQVEHLSKRYRIGVAQARTTIQEQIGQSLRRMLRGRRKSTTKEFWALSDVSFEVPSGQVVGIIGRNGAGKSTLLKILSRITEPTKGVCHLRGRTGSLLEVGTGFHPELTGRENIFLNGAILGMRKAEIARRFEEIVDFADIGEFLDTPVKRYSSGMYVRLAFAVAAHLEPEILIVDEVLAVGDVAFQKKCLGKMSDVAESGRTVLFVSHNLVAVERLCHRAIRLDQGRLIDDGGPSDVISRYLEGAYSTLEEASWVDPAAAPGNDQIRLARVALVRESLNNGDQITVRTPLRFDVDYWNLRPGNRLSVSLQFINQREITVFNTFPVNEPVWHGKPFPRGLFRSSVFVPGDLLNTGTYRIRLRIVRDQGVVLYRQEDVLVFEVHDAPEARGDWHGEWRGAVRPLLRWETLQLLDQSSDAVLPETKNSQNIAVR